ncbi:MAG: hypothetical protein H9789_10675 [Candidatus Paraprevotella stercoravium]|uniref:Uncharacterized protein n=2 Tax=Bacteroidales TaxID=171549 RepID=A0ABT7U5D1_9BACE|nr:hypothetical protein [Candidatus Paraprevotella stercoravium]MDM8145738.1 hypothetical protein [Bacteroides eggerthii]
MKNKKYISPQIEIIEHEVKDSFLTCSNEIQFGGNTSDLLPDEEGNIWGD